MVVAAVAFGSSFAHNPDVSTVTEFETDETTVKPTMKPTEEPPIPTETASPVCQSEIYSLDWDSDEAYLLAKIAMAEAEDQDTEGKALVICVVLNRVWTEEFTDSIKAVIYQDKQFSPVANGRFDRVEPDQDCWDALLMVEQGWDESQGALYFESESSSTWHREHLQFLFQHGDHMFYADKE